MARIAGGGRDLASRSSSTRPATADARFDRRGLLDVVLPDLEGG